VKLLQSLCIYLLVLYCYYSPLSYTLLHAVKLSFCSLYVVLCDAFLANKPHVICCFVCLCCALCVGGGGASSSSGGGYSNNNYSSNNSHSNAPARSNTSFSSHGMYYVYITMINCLTYITYIVYLLSEDYSTVLEYQFHVFLTHAILYILRNNKCA